MKDIILVTIDCWRDDALGSMPKLSDSIVDRESSSLVCASAATHGAFAAILSSQYYPEAYTDSGEVREDITPLPEVLSDEGFATGGFVASNPYVGRWSEYFDEWWNDGMNSAELGENEEVKVEDRTMIDEVRSLVELTPPVSAEEILSRADEWWERQSSPRFLWVHLMEPHEPFLPGFDRGREAGLLKSYASLIINAKFKDLDEESFRDDVPTWAREQLRELYYRSNEQLDSVLGPWIEEREDEATIVVTGDHGEEFDHGVLRHARLYDEVVRVPIVTTESLGELSEGGLGRQIDLGPTLLAELDVSTPDGWEGEVFSESMPPQLIINSAPQLGRDWVGIRSEEWKIIRPYDWERGKMESEAYNLASDPAEVDPLDESEAPDSLSEALDEFVDRPDVGAHLEENGDLETGLNSDVEGRLKELGYVE